MPFCCGCDMSVYPRLILRSLVISILKDLVGDEFFVEMQTDTCLFIVDDVPAWSPALRSKTKIRISPKRHFVDPSIAVALMGINPQGLLKDFPTFGFLFEDLCARDLRVYAQALDGEVYHYLSL